MIVAHDDTPKKQKVYILDVGRPNMLAFLTSAMNENPHAKVVSLDIDDDYEEDEEVRRDRIELHSLQYREDYDPKSGISYEEYCDAYIPED
jgi:hypothetical protein